MIEVKSYKDLIELRDMQEKVLESFIESRELLDKAALKGPSELGAIEIGAIGSKFNMTMGIYARQLNLVNGHIETAVKLLESYERSINIIESTVDGLDDLDYKVVYLREIKGMTLSEIAYELSYSIDRIKQISAKHKKADYTTSTLTGTK